MSGGGSTGQKPMSLLSMGTAPCRAKTLSSVSSMACRADTCSHEAIFVRIHARAAQTCIDTNSMQHQAGQSQLRVQCLSLATERRPPEVHWGCRESPQAADSPLAC